jgi:formiminotetrahydrofolate cyclodeaminase
MINLPSISDEDFVKEKKQAMIDIHQKAKILVSELAPIVESRIG